MNRNLKTDDRSKYVESGPLALLFQKRINEKIIQNILWTNDFTNKAKTKTPKGEVGEINVQ